QIERVPLDHSAHGFGDRSVVGGRRDVFARHDHVEVEVNDELLRLVLLTGTGAVVPTRPDPGQEQLRGAHGSPSSRVATSRSSSSSSTRSTQGGRRSSWIATTPEPSPCPCGSCRYRARRYS